MRVRGSGALWSGSRGGASQTISEEFVASIPCPHPTRDRSAYTGSKWGQRGDVERRDSPEFLGILEFELAVKASWKTSPGRHLTDTMAKMSDRVSRGFVLVALLTITLIAAALRFVRLDAGLPYLFHSDAFQIGQALHLLEFGWFTDSVNYPHALVHVYAWMARIEHACRSWFVDTGASGPESFAVYLDHLREPTHHQTLGRVFSAVCGTLLAPAVYHLARARFDRVVALIAAAAIACDPSHVITAHQVRPHAPVVLLIVGAASLLLRVAADPAARVRSFVCGGVVGLATATFQLGWFELAWAIGIVFVFVRPWRDSIRVTGLVGAGFAWVFVLVTAWGHRDEVVRAVALESARDAASTLSLPATLIARGSFERLRETAFSWFFASPLTILLAASFLVVLGFRRRWRSFGFDLAAFVGLPLLVFVAMGGFVGSFARYSLTATPFLAVLGAATCESARLRRFGGMLAVVWIGCHAAFSIRYLDLVDSVDTRVSANVLALELESRGATVAVQDRLVIDRSILSSRVFEFPPHDRSRGAIDRPLGPRAQLRTAGTTAFLTTPGSQPAFSQADLESLGLSYIGAIGTAPTRVIVLPDLSERLFVDLFVATRTGPKVEVFVAPSQRGAWETSLDPVGSRSTFPEAAATLAARRTARDSRVSGVGFERGEVDLDADGIPERYIGNVTPAELARRLALEREDWPERGGTSPNPRSTTNSPRLRVCGRLAANEPVLVVVSGLEAARDLHFLATPILDGRSLAPRVFRFPIVAADALVLAFAWPADAPLGLGLELQGFAVDADGAIAASEKRASP